MVLLDAMLEFISRGEARRIQAAIDRLVILNQKTANNTALGVLHRGYLLKHSQAPKGNLWHALDPSLEEEGEALRLSHKQVSDDIQLIKQGLLPLVQNSQTTQDLRDALPECLIQCADYDWIKLPRTRPEAWNIEPGSRAYRQYLKIIPKLEFFTAARLIY